MDGPGSGRPLNVPGGLALTVGLGLAAYGITASGVLPWSSARVWGILLAAAVLLVLFTRAERVTRQRLVPSQAWRNGRLLRALGLAGLGQWVLVPTFLTVSLYIQLVLEQSPLRAGLALLPMSVLIAAIAPGIPKVINGFGLRTIMSAAFAFVAAGMCWLGFVDAGGSLVASILGPALLIALGLPTIAVTTDLAAGISTQTTNPMRPQPDSSGLRPELQRW